MNLYYEPKMTKAKLLEYISKRKYWCIFCSELQKKVMEEGLQAIDNYQGMICAGVEDMKIRNWQAKQADKRPDNYEKLSSQEQWEIDKGLGILDWDGTDEEGQKE